MGSIALTLAVLYAISAIVGYLQSFTVVTITQRFSQRFRTAIQKKINTVPLNYFDSHSQGDILSRVTNDVDLWDNRLVRSGYSNYFKHSLGSSHYYDVLLKCYYGFHCDWFCLDRICSSSLYHGLLATTFKRQQENLANINGYIEEIYTGQAVVTSYNASKESSQDFKGLNDKLYNSMWQSQFISGIMMPLMIFIGNFGYVMVCLVGAVKVIDGSLTIGDVVAFMTYVRIFSQPLSQIAQGITQLQSATAAIGSIFEFLEEKDMDDESVKTAELTDTKGQVVFDHVSFGYTPEKTIIHDFSALAKPGQRLLLLVRRVLVRQPLLTCL